MAISITTADAYVSGYHNSVSTQVCVLQLVPQAGFNDPGMASIFNYLHSKQRWGCIKNLDLHKDIKDVYVVLVEAGMGPLPHFMQNLEDLSIEDPRPYNGLYIVFMIKTQATPPRELDGAMDVHMDGTSVSAAPESTPVLPNAPTPAFPPGAGVQAYQSADPGYNPTEQQREILGPYIGCTTVKQLIMGAQMLNETQLRNLRHILDRDPAAREDLQELGRHLQARKREVEEDRGAMMA